MSKEVKEAIEIVENALMFYAEEGIRSDKKAQKELDNAWNILVKIHNDYFKKISTKEKYKKIWRNYVKKNRKSF